MAVPSSLTLSYDAVLSTTLFNIKRELKDQISTNNVLLYYIMKKNKLYEEDGGGDRVQIPLMHELGRADSYAGYDVLDTTPVDGITSAFYEWGQMAGSVTISGIEERKNKGDKRILNLLKAKTKQAVLGIEDKFGRAFLQGNGVNGGNLYDQYVSPANGSVFIEPLPSLVRYDNATSDSIGNINQSTYSFWRNQVKDASALTTYATILNALRNQINNCGKGPGGGPDLHVADQLGYELIERALASFYQNTSIKTADIPFDNFTLRGKPVVWDEFVPNAYTNTVTVASGAKSTLYSLNTKTLGIKYDGEADFEPQGFQKPTDQDAKTNLILWQGVSFTDNRRKNGVTGGLKNDASS